MYLSNEAILKFCVGLIAGRLAGKIVRGTGIGVIGDIAIGIVGAFAQLMRERLRHLDRVSAILLSDAGGSIKELQNCLARSVELIDVSGTWERAQRG